MSVRSSPYPIITVSAAIELGKKIYDSLGMKEYYSGDVIAKIFKKSATTLKQEYSTLCQYGLLAKKNKVGYKVTDLLYECIYPKDKNEAIELYKSCILNSKLYNDLIESFDGDKLPVKEALRPLLIRDHGITDRAVEVAIEVFIENLDDLDLIDDNNILNFKSSVDFYNDDGDEVSSEKKENSKEENFDSNGGFNGNNGKSGFREQIPIFLDNERTAYLKLPIELHEEDIKQLIGAIEFLVKPIIRKSNQ